MPLENKDERDRKRSEENKVEYIKRNLSALTKWSTWRDYTRCLREEIKKKKHYQNKNFDKETKHWSGHLLKPQKPLSSTCTQRKVKANGDMK